MFVHLDMFIISCEPSLNSGQNYTLSRILSHASQSVYFLLPSDMNSCDGAGKKTNF